MTTSGDPGGQHACRDWWSTSIIDMTPGIIRFRGYAIQDLIGEVDFVSMIWLMLRGELPRPEQADLLGAALVASVDHGPQAPSIAIARMAMTCGVGINNAMASASNALGDVHGGAGEQAMHLFSSIAAQMDQGAGLDVAVDAALDEAGQSHLPGFGHRFHPVDPRTPRLLALVDTAAGAGTVTGRFAHMGRAVESALAERKGRHIPMNIDGVTAVVFSELGFAAELGRGLFVVARSVGILAHAWEQRQQGGRNKGPIPPEMLYRYTGLAPRVLNDGSQDGDEC